MYMFVLCFIVLCAGDHGSRGDTVSVAPPPMPPPPPQPARGQAQEESEAKMRQRLIERARRMRMAVSEAHSTPTLTVRERTLQQVKGCHMTNTWLSHDSHYQHMAVT